MDKDTHVNLDMQMWITHNETTERTTQQTMGYPTTAKPTQPTPAYQLPKAYVKAPEKYNDQVG